MDRYTLQGSGRMRACEATYTRARVHGAAGRTRVGTRAIRVAQVQRRQGRQLSQAKSGQSRHAAARLQPRTCRSGRSASMLSMLLPCSVDCTQQTNANGRQCITCKRRHSSDGKSCRSSAYAPRQHQTTRQDARASSAITRFAPSALTALLDMSNSCSFANPRKGCSRDTYTTA